MVLPFSAWKNGSQSARRNREVRLEKSRGVAEVEFASRFDGTAMAIFVSIPSRVAAAIIVKHVLVFLFALSASMATGAELCPATDTKAEWSRQCFEGEGEHRRVKPAFVDRLRVDQSGFTTIFIGERLELLAVDRHGKVIVPNIRHTGDADYPNAHLGVGRFSIVGEDASGKRMERCGYFRSKGFDIIVPARFDHCQAFWEDKAYACTGCIRYCDGPDCHHDRFVGGRIFVLGSDGTVKRDYPGPELSTICGQQASVRAGKSSSGTPTFQCTTLSGHPFHM